MSVKWRDKAFADFCRWYETDKKTAKKIHSLVLDIQRNGVLKGTGKPEALKYEHNEYSRRIDEKNRLVYTQDENGTLVILACKGHYEE